nr:Os03g0143150 [Ipomoea trifida]
MIQGATFASEDFVGPLFPAEHETKIPFSMAEKAPIAMVSRKYGAEPPPSESENLVGGHAGKWGHPAGDSARVTEEAGVRYVGPSRSTGGVGPVPFTITRRIGFSATDSSTRRHAGAAGVEPSADELFIAVGFRVEIRGGIAPAAPPRRHIRHAGIVKALRLRPHPGIQNPHDHVLTSPLRRAAARPKPKPRIQPEKLRSTGRVQTVH